MELSVVDLTRATEVVTATRRGAFHHVVCPLDAYPDGPVRAAHEAKLEPESEGGCGTVALTTAGTAAGIWWYDLDAFLDPFGVTKIADGLSLLPAVRRPGEEVIAVGDPSVGLGNHSFFHTRGVAGARHSPSFETLTAAAGVACFDGLHTHVNVAAEDFGLGHFFIELQVPDEAGRPWLLVERVAEGPCPDEPAIAAHAFAPSAARYWLPGPGDVIP
jgi:hypothetical protein